MSHREDSATVFGYAWSPHIGRLQVPENRPFLVNGSHGLANLYEQSQSLTHTQAGPIPVLGDRNATNQVRAAMVDHAAVNSAPFGAGVRQILVFLRRAAHRDLAQEPAFSGPGGRTVW